MIKGVNSSIITINTPIEEYYIGKRKIFVKREDLCISETSFSKARGVYEHLSNINENHIGVLDSYHSKAGWAVSYIGKVLNKKVHLFYPEFKHEPGFRESQENGKKFGAELIPLQAGMQAVLYNRAKSILKSRFGDDCYMMPNALKLIESVNETERETDLIDNKFLHNYTWVISISSGTIAAGVLKSLIKRNSSANVILHLGYSRKQESVEKYLLKYLLDFGKLNIIYIDENYSYKQSVEFNCPFPCNKYYDLKAWKWLNESIDAFDEDIVFWNIGK